jgi:hypothetical protein
MEGRGGGRIKEGRESMAKLVNESFDCLKHYLAGCGIGPLREKRGCVTSSFTFSRSFDLVCTSKEPNKSYEVALAPCQYLRTSSCQRAKLLGSLVFYVHREAQAAKESGYAQAEEDLAQRHAVSTRNSSKHCKLTKDFFLTLRDDQGHKMQLARIQTRPKTTLPCDSHY